VLRRGGQRGPWLCGAAFAWCAFGETRRIQVALIHHSIRIPVDWLRSPAPFPPLTLMMSMTSVMRTHHRVTTAPRDEPEVHREGCGSGDQQRNRQAAPE
jgi:hypothetical protein